MKKGYLSTYFQGVAGKRLSEVEVNPNKSNQHEFDGVSDLIKLFGVVNKGERLTFEADFLYLNDDDPVSSGGYVTWYESRGDFYPKKGNGPKRFRTEHRLYYPTTNVSNNASVGDLLIVAKRPEKSVLVIIAEADSTIANQIQWLFGIDTSHHPGFSVREELETEQDRLSFASRIVLETIGVNVEETEDTFLDIMLSQFDGQFPDTKVFSDFARSKVSGLDPLENPDVTITTWMDRELILFQTLERYLIGERLKRGFIDENGKTEVDAFLSTSLSVQNRRKSRAGHALENHLEELFRLHEIKFDRGKITENKSKPDFLFPGHCEYHDSQFPEIRLSMLGVKTTCKDRWRQVLTEAKRIENKHLMTLEPGISVNQTDEMKANKLQLVVPESLHTSYVASQQGWLMSIRNFIDMVLSRQV